MIRKFWGLSIVLGLLVNSGILSASGLSLFEVGSRAASMSGAFVGLADNTSAIYYNPAGIAFQKGVGFRVNVMYSNYTITAESNTEQDSRSYDSANERLLGSFFVSWNLLEKFSIGIGGFTPYTMETHWPINWPGEQLSSISKVATFYLRPSIAWEVTDGLAIGAGLDFVWASQKWESEMFYRYNIMQLNGTGIGFSGGILFKLSARFQLGGRYQHRVKIDQTGTYKAQSSPSTGEYTVHSAAFSTHNNSSSALGSTFLGSSILLQDTMDVLEFYDIIGSLTLPSEAVFGLMWSPLKRLRILADVQWTEWSTIKKYEFESENPDDHDTQTIDFNWKDTWSYMFGFEYLISETLSLKGGYGRHPSPSPDETLSPIFPVLPHNILSLGVGYNGPVRTITDQSLLGKLTFDLFIQYVMAEKTTSTLVDLPLHYFNFILVQDFPFTYSGNNFVLGFGVGLNF